MSNGKWTPNVIIRVGKGSTKPLDPGWQHRGDYSDSFNLMLERCRIFELTSSDMIMSTYEQAYEIGGVNLIMEYPELYSN